MLLAEEPPEQVDCTTDAECGVGNHCAEDSFCLGSCGCAPTGCSTDDDCEAGFACRCGELQGTCIPASCRSDADCPDDRLCLETRSTYCAIGFEYETAFGLACQSPEDECLTDNECVGGDVCQGRPGTPRRCEALEECEGSSCGP